MVPSCRDCLASCGNEVVDQDGTGRTTDVPGRARGLICPAKGVFGLLSVDDSGRIWHLTGFALTCIIINKIALFHESEEI